MQIQSRVPCLLKQRKELWFLSADLYRMDYGYLKSIVINSRCLQIKNCNYSVSKVAIKNNEFKTFWPAFRVVSITDLSTANILAPSVDLKCPDIFCLTFTFLIALSEPLLSGGLVFAPFHILGTEGKTYFDKQHPWHLESIKKFCDFNSKHLMVTANISVDLQNQDSIQQAIDWWKELTSKGGEGMVVKPLDYISSFKGRTVQPAMKCRGSEYLRIIYGPEYDTADNLQTLKERNVKVKRDLGIKEFTLGLESLDRFVNKQPLGRIHECVFGVLALESESVDPRL